MNRKQRRATAVSRKKAIKKSKETESEFAQKVALFGHLPESCMTCAKPFDKQDRDMVMTWHVAVREAEEKVNLYCPTCWQKAISVIEMMTKELEGAQENESEPTTI